MSLGFEAAGFNIGASVEIDPVHCAVHEYNFPYSATLCKSIVDVKTSEIEHSLSLKGFNQVDVIVGGPPCQGFSQIGKRQLEDPRNALVFQYLRLVKQIRPKYFVFENVKGMTLGNHHIFIKELIEEFTKAKYRVLQPYKVLNAADYGVAQNRHRFILIGVREDQNDISYPVPTHTPVHPQQISVFTNHHIGSRQAIADLENLETFLDEDYGIPFTDIFYNDYTKSLGYVPTADFALCHRRTITQKLVFGHSGSRHTIDSQRRFLSTPCGETESISRFFKLHPDKPSNTLRAGTDSKRGAYTAARPIHYSEPRCITIREGARLHSFPDWFRFHTTIWHGFRQLGNSVAPLFARKIGEQILHGLGIDPSCLVAEQLSESNEHLVCMNMAEACKYYGVTDVIGKRDRKVKEASV